LDITVSMDMPARIKIPIYVRHLWKVGSAPVNEVDPTAWLHREWVFYLLGDEGPLLDAGEYVFYFNPALHLTFEGERIGQGRENVKKFLAENTDILERISSLVRVKAGLDKKPETEEDQDSPAE